MRQENTLLQEEYMCQQSYLLSYPLQKTEQKPQQAEQTSHQTDYMQHEDQVQQYLQAEHTHHKDQEQHHPQAEHAYHQAEYLEARLNSIVISHGPKIITTALGGCIVTANILTKEEIKTLVVTHYAPFCTEEHIRQLEERIVKQNHCSTTSAVFFKRKSPNVNNIAELLREHCQSEVQLVRYSGYNEQVISDIKTMTWRTRESIGQL